MIDFNKKQRPGGRMTIMCDVSVTYATKSGKSGKKTLCFTFSEKAVIMICGEGHYAVVGVDKHHPDRIYFAPSTSVDGYKLTRSKTHLRYSCSFGYGVEYDNPTSFVGFYSLEYDAKQGALYINRNNKKQED